MAAGGRVYRDTCVTCHSVDGSPGTGPSWEGLWGSERQLDDGTSTVADEAYVTRSIREPQAQLVEGYGPVMPKLDLSDADVIALVAYIRSLGAGE